MATFHKKLDRLLAEARERGILDAQASESLAALAAARERGGGLLSLSGVLGWLGALALGLGVILLISANWARIDAVFKIGGFLGLLASVHAGGLWIRLKELPYRKTAEALHTLGAILVIAGIGLIAQIYHLDGNPPQAVVLWFVAIAPLAWLLGSPGITVTSLFALALWAHLLGGTGGTMWRIADSFASHLLIELGLGLGALGLSARVRRSDPAVAAALSACGATMLFGVLYLFGFYRHFGTPWYDSVRQGAPWIPLGALSLGVAGLAVAWTDFAADAPLLRPRILAGLGALVLFGLLVLGVEHQWIPAGPKLEFFNFGWSQTFNTAEWLLSFYAWGLWFGLALLAVAFGSTGGRPAYLNLGVLAVGLGVVTRFFDLVGSLAETGFLFVTGGAVLLVTAFLTERWRKRLTQSLPGGAS
jgi:hypothetical protein